MSLPSLLQLPALMRSNKQGEAQLQTHPVAPTLALSLRTTDSLFPEQLKPHPALLYRSPGLTMR